MPSLGFRFVGKKRAFISLHILTIQKKMNEYEEVRCPFSISFHGKTR